MTDGEHNEHRWLTDDPLLLNAVFLVAASSLAIALTSCLWHHLHSLDPDNLLLLFRISPARSLPPTAQQHSLSMPQSSLVAEQKDRKGTRSKERRRRGKDPFRDLLKGGKKSKALLKAIKTADNDNPSPSACTFSNGSVPVNDSASSTSRSQSPELPRDLSDVDRSVPSLGAEFDEGGSVRDAIPNGNTPSTSAVASSGDISDHSASGAWSHADHCRSRSCPPDSMTAAEAEVNVSSASTVVEHATEVAPSSPPVSTARTEIHMPQPCISQAAFTGGSCAKFVRARTRFRASKLDLSARSSSSPATDSVASHSAVPCPSLSIEASTHSTDGAGPSTPTNFRESTLSPRPLSPSEGLGHGELNTEALDESVTAQTQLASLRDALEAARLREEQLRVEAEQASKERDEFCWRWNEDAGAWRRREAELQAQIHHLVQQLQAYAAVASFQVQQASNLASSPAHSSPPLQHHALGSFPLPPAIQTQNSASAPAYVQALLTSHPPGFAAPMPGGLYSGAGHGMSPLSWSGMGLCVPNWEPRHSGRQTPDSSVSGSSPRGRRRQRCTNDVRSASDESSLGDWDGSGDEDVWEGEEEEDIFRNNVLADAILKRPESIRVLSGSVRKRSGMDTIKDPLATSGLEKYGFMPPLVDTAVTQ